MGYWTIAPWPGVIRTAQRQSTNTDAVQAPTNYTQVVRLQGLVHRAPDIACADRRYVLLLRQRHVFELCQRHGDAVLDVGGPSKSSVASAPHCERALGETRQQDHNRELFRLARREDAGGTDIALDLRPEVPEKVIIRSLARCVDGVPPIDELERRALASQLVKKKRRHPVAFMQERQLTAAEQGE